MICKMGKKNQNTEKKHKTLEKQKLHQRYRRPLLSYRC